MPSWYDRRKYSKKLLGAAEVRSSEQFRVNRFRQQYFLSNYELQARGYEKISLIKGCNCIIQGSFDGFVSVNHCTIKIVGPIPAGGGQRPAPEFVVAVCMIPPQRRVSLGVDVETQSSFTMYFVEFWRYTGAGAIGSSSFDPDLLLMQVKHFAEATDANIAATRMLLSNIAVTLPPINAEKDNRDGWAIDARIPGESSVECAALEISYNQNKDFCYPVMIKRGIEKIMQFATEGEKTEKG